MAEFGKAVVSNTAPTFLDRLLREFELAGDAGKNVMDVMDALTRLQAKRNDLQRAISKSVQQKRPEEVANWFSRVEKVEKKVSKIQQDHDRRCLCAGSFSPNICSSYAVSRRAVEKLDTVNRLLAEYDTVKNLTGKSPPPSCIPEPVPPVLLGMSSCLSKALGYLDDDEVGIVGVCGMAGVGKSTLMRCINNEFLGCAERGEDFEYVMWVEGSSSDVKKLQDDIAHRLGLDQLGLSEDAERRARPIFNFLKNKSFLVLLDNVMSPLKLTDIGIPDPKHRGTQKQKVVLTTRIKGVCGRMNSCRRIDMECLDWQQSWDLFKATVGEGTIGDEAIRGIAEEITKECGGLPLALTTIGRAMAMKSEPQDWSSTARLLKSSQLHRIPGMEKENTAMLQVLQRSYDHLPTPAVRKCFLCCSLWPEGSAIDKNELIDCWIGLGLIDESSPDEAVRTGFSIISCLQEANLLGAGDNAGLEVKLHDVIRDMALWIACDCGKRENKWLVQAGVGLRSKPKLKELSERAVAAERVSLMRNSIEVLPQARLSSCPDLAVLMLQQNKTLRDISGNFLQSAPALTYLDLSDTAIRELPKEIGMLAMLQYLNLSSTLIEALPKELGSLEQLKHLLLRHTSHLSRIPAGVFRRLFSLQVLDMYPSQYMEWGDRQACGSGDGNEGITGFEEMNSNMIFIKSLGITICTFRTLQMLGRLNNVCTRRLLMTQFNSPPSVTLCPSRFKKLLKSFSLLETLQELSITTSSALRELVFDGEEDEKPNQSWSLPRLEKLQLSGLSKLAAVLWKRMAVPYFFPMLQHVEITNCNCLKNVSWVLHLQRLEHLELRHCSGMRTVIDDEHSQDTDEDGPTFPCLKTLLLVDLPWLSSICGTTVSFPRLEVIEVARCSNLRQLHIEPQGKLREIRGSMDWWQGLEWERDNIKPSLDPCFVDASAI